MKQRKIKLISETIGTAVQSYNEAIIRNMASTQTGYISGITKMLKLLENIDITLIRDKTGVIKIAEISKNNCILNVITFY